MRTTSTLAFLLLAGLVAGAVLPPTASAPLPDHMAEVNTQWTRIKALDGTELPPVQFRSEADRISTHLGLVIGTLARREHPNLSTSAMDHRQHLLNRLAAYAAMGIFPQNHVLPVRNPVFIDPHGTACAVGWMMIESGHSDLAERISAVMNLAYVRDMVGTDLWPEIAKWADAHGFTPDELAWIQPGYPPNVPWAPFGGGTDGPVKVLLTLADGQVLVAGAFNEAGSTAISGVALWNGSSLVPIGTGFQGNFACAAEHNGQIYLGGAMINGIHDLAIWDGEAWSFEVVFESKLPNIHDLHVHDGVLHAAGSGMGFAGMDNRVLRLVDGGWEALGDPFNEAVLALESYNGELVAAGAFTQPVGSTDPLLLHVARYDGAGWHQLGDGLDATVHDLLTMDGVLHAAGDLFANIAVTFGLARISGASDTWEHLLPNHADYMSGGPGPAYFAAMATHNELLYLVGDFHMYTFTVIGNHVAVFNGTPDYLEPLAALDQPVNAVAIADERIIIGGEFDLWLPHLAAVDITTQVPDGLGAAQDLVMVPSLVVDFTTIHVPDHVRRDAPVQVLDATGRALPVRWEYAEGRLRLDASGLGAGMHVVRITTGRGVLTGRFVKE